MDFLERLSLLMDKNKIDVLNKSTVMVLGIGGVGSYCVEALVRSGIGKIILIDPDSIDISNINRQLIALHSTIGRKKVEVMRDRILDISPNCEVVIYDFFYNDENATIPFLEQKIDFVVDACDSIKSKERLILQCQSRDVSFIVSTGTGNRMDPSCLEITTLEKTSNDPLSRILRKWMKENHINKKIPVLWSSEVPIKVKDGIIGSNSFVPASAGLMIASYVIQQLIKKI